MAADSSASDLLLEELREGGACFGVFNDCDGMDFKHIGPLCSLFKERGRVVGLE
jgi:hypothetical protein